jgi:hypothetical protein
MIIMSDISDQFEFLSELLAYHDGPIEGFLREKDSQQLFAFRVSFVIPDLLWHWVLIPAASTADGVASAFSRPAATRGRWMSIVEDRRGGEPRLLAEWIEDGSRVPVEVLDR